LIKRSDLLDFMRQEKHAVQATSASAGPQAAVVGIVVSDAFEIFFDTLDTTRKARNLRLDPKVAFVVGGTGQNAERTVQYQGLVDEPTGADLTRLKQLYFSRFPDGPGRESWEGITYFRARPTWLRYSDYTKAPPLIVEFSAPDLANLR
jgi:Pyridoxamine 5'-phosphate oxidase